MDISELTVKILLLLIPGMISTSLYEFITRRKIDTRKYICSAIFSSFICYLLVLITYNLNEVIFNGINGFSSKKIVFFDALLRSDVNIKYSEIIFASGFGFVIGIIKTIFMNKGWIFKLLRLLRLTNESGNTVWLDLFDNDTKGTSDSVYVVRASENKVYGGHLESFSSVDESRELVLNNVVVYENTDRNKKIGVLDKVYFNFQSDDIIIEFKKMNRGV